MVRRALPALSLLLAMAAVAPAAAQPSPPAAPPPGASPPAAAPPSSDPAPPPAAPPPGLEASPPAPPPADDAPPPPPPPGAQLPSEGMVAPPPAVAPETEPLADQPPGLAPIPKHRLYLASLTVLRYNPLGLETQNRLVFQRRLMDSTSVLFRDTFVSGAASLKLNPAYFRVGPTVELQPIALLNIRAGYEFVYYFGSLGFLQSYPDPTSSYADSAREAIEDSAYSTPGHHLFVEPTLQVKVKSIALRSKFGIEYWNMKLRDGDQVFYDATLDTQVPGKGVTVANDTDLVYLAGQLTFGARFSAVWPLYTPEHFGPSGEPQGFGGNSHTRIGPLVAYSFNTRENSLFNKPTLLGVAGWYLDHPNRGGALPYMLLGFSFSSDFLSAQ